MDDNNDYGNMLISSFNTLAYNYNHLVDINISLEENLAKLQNQHNIEKAQLMQRHDNLLQDTTALDDKHAKEIEDLKFYMMKYKTMIDIVIIINKNVGNQKHPMAKMEFINKYN